ncbi:Aste57867_12499 [Aphanomyces stellatus]|uniref:RBR-type E3 ubiquitin transferase n=1 Tax=Aphanomyces stellatus TaxID=120398 RepID=A0A485KW42_9STRA|nr:hypothetical protein As57867_012453 [Aphanomyces stellatus]VFT89350.1 Aste57867_12499 [Aphanomyces stellatus]
MAATSGLDVVAVALALVAGKWCLDLLLACPAYVYLYGLAALVLLAIVAVLGFYLLVHLFASAVSAALRPKSRPKTNVFFFLFVPFAFLSGLFKCTAALAPRRMPPVARRPKAPPRLVRCIVCLDQVPATDGVVHCPACPPDKLCCSPCMEKHLQAKLTSRQVVLGCPGCNSPLAPDTLKRFLSPFWLRQLHQLREEQHAFSCPTCHSPCVDSRFSKTSVTCASCKASWCLDCGHKYHYFATAACRDATFRRWRSQHNVKACPHCKRYIEKTVGCDHMTCAKCAHQFCWRCKGAWTAPHTCGKRSWFS